MRHHCIKTVSRYDLELIISILPLASPSLFQFSFWVYRSHSKRLLEFRERKIATKGPRKTNMKSKRSEKEAAVSEESRIPCWIFSTRQILDGETKLRKLQAERDKMAYDMECLKVSSNSLLYIALISFLSVSAAPCYSFHVRLSCARQNSRIRNWARSWSASRHSCKGWLIRRHRKMTPCKRKWTKWDVWSRREK